jgi:DNA-binding transcriptional ArsR family regulator
MSLKLAKRQEEFLKTISNSNRLEMLKILLRREMSVGSLAEQIGLSQSALSQHLSKLREQGLVTTRRVGQTIYYSCNDAGVTKIVSTLAEIFPYHAIKYLGDGQASERMGHK